MKGDHATQKSERIKLSKDPLVHFVVIAFMLIGFDWVTGTISDQSPIIHISTSPQKQLSDTWAVAAGRQPTSSEFQNIVANHIRNEVLFREAQKRGLDDGDIIIRRRLIQKFEFLSEDISATSIPDEETLKDWYQANSNRFTPQPRRSLIHIFFANNNSAKSRIEKTLIELQKPDKPTEENHWLKLGDAFPFERNLVEITETELSAEFGANFSDPVFEAQLHHWIGPIPSAFGQHLIMITNETKVPAPNLRDIQRQVINIWREEQNQVRQEAFINDLISQYEVRIEDSRP